MALALLLTFLGTSSAQNLSPPEVSRLLGRARTGVANADFDGRLADKLGRVAYSDPSWPVYAFLRAELLLQLQRTKPAADGYRSLVEFAASNPYKDTWGGHGLAAFALYRWLALYAASGSTERAPFEQMANWADSVLETRLVRSAFRPNPILASMPLLEEEIYHALAAGALRVGSSTRAANYFLDYLSRMRSEGVAPESDPLYGETLKQGASTPDGIALVYGKHLLSLEKVDAALPYLEKAEDSKNYQTQLEAKYLHAKAARKMSRGDRSKIYQEVQRYATNDELAQSALLSDGLQFRPTEPKFKEVLGAAVSAYPGGPLTDEALHWLTWGARITGDLEGACKWQEMLRKDYGQSRYLSRSAIEVALAYIWRGHTGDLDVASRVLNDFLNKQPSAEDLPRSLFWLGRIAEQQGHEVEARDRFEETAKAAWFDYYGLRARMHLASGRGARSQILVESPALVAEIGAAYALDPAAPPPPRQAGAYYRRLETALGSGLYRTVFDGESALRAVDASKRVQDMTFEELDNVGFLAPIAVMMALRQDALAAADADPSLPDRLALARQLGGTAGDWPGLLSSVHPTSVRPAARRAELMRTPGYLRVAYPLVFEPLIREATTRQMEQLEPARRPYFGRVAPAWLYAVMRQESFFYTAALSKKGALGLFQFMPGTFDTLGARWKLLAGDAAPARAAYLMSERLSIPLGARWLAQELLSKFDYNLLFSTLAHHSGGPLVMKWKEQWKQRGWTDDVETMIESFRMDDFIPEASDASGIEARGFARNVMTDIAVVDVLALYRDRPK